MFKFEIVQEGLGISDIFLDPLKVLISKRLDKLDTENQETLVSGFKLFTARVEEDGEYLVIKGLEYKKLFQRLNQMYDQKSFQKILTKIYTEKSLKKFNQKKISRSKLKIQEVRFHLFFALEISILFDDLYNYYGIGYYKKIANQIRTKTYLKNILSNKLEKIPVDMDKIKKNIKYELKPYQKEFIEIYPSLKNKYKLDGYLLSFDQGLGKTLTSIALSEVLNKDLVVIVCPNSLKENWSYEIKSYFYKYDDDEKWKSDVYVIGEDKKYHINKNTKYLILNYEALPKVFNVIKYLGNNKNSMLIIDEMHNFRNINAKGTTELIILKKRLDCHDVLPMSGTPIKASPNEIVPTLCMIDPLFNYECASIYNRAFNVDSDSIQNVVHARFGISMYRRTKDQVLALPNKYKHDLYLNTNDSLKYLSHNVKTEISNRFKEIYEKEYNSIKEWESIYYSYVDKYHTCSNDDYKRYKNIVSDFANQSIELHELDEEFYKSFDSKYVIPSITESNELKEFKQASTKFLRMNESCMGKAIGEIMPVRRKEMYISLYENNKEKIIEMIETNDKKTVIFSCILDVVKYISNDLDKEGIKNIRIVGGTKNRIELIQEFKNSDDINVLLATDKTLATGVTLTEANQMLFFGTPWRYSDYEQCCDRIHRIGQNTDVNIYNVLLKTDAENLSTRMNKILNWSGDMFDSMIDNVTESCEINSSLFDYCLSELL